MTQIRAHSSPGITVSYISEYVRAGNRVSVDFTSGISLQIICDNRGNPEAEVRYMKTASHFFPLPEFEVSQEDLPRDSEKINVESKIWGASR